MAKPSDLTADAVAGFNGEPAAGRLWSSPVWYAYALGEYFKASGRSQPRDVRMGRGDSIRANDMRFTFKHDTLAGYPVVSFERVS